MFSFVCIWRTPSFFNCLLDQNRQILRKRPQKQQLSICNLNLSLPSPSSSSSTSSSFSWVYGPNCGATAFKCSEGIPGPSSPGESKLCFTTFFGVDPSAFASSGLSWKAQNLNLAQMGSLLGALRILIRTFAHDESSSGMSLMKKVVWIGGKCARGLTRFVDFVASSSICVFESLFLIKMINFSLVSNHEFSLPVG